MRRPGKSTRCSGAFARRGGGCGTGIAPLNGCGCEGRRRRTTTKDPQARCDDAGASCSETTRLSSGWGASARALLRVAQLLRRAHDHLEEQPDDGDEQRGPDRPPDQPFRETHGRMVRLMEARQEQDDEGAEGDVEE